MSRVVATEWEIETGARLRRGEWYRVTSIHEWDGSVISKSRHSTLRAAKRERDEWEQQGITAYISIRAPGTK